MEGLYAEGGDRDGNDLIILCLGRDGYLLAPQPPRMDRDGRWVSEHRIVKRMSLRAAQKYLGQDGRTVPVSSIWGKYPALRRFIEARVPGRELYRVAPHGSLLVRVHWIRPAPNGPTEENVSLSVSDPVPTGGRRFSFVEWEHLALRTIGRPSTHLMRHRETIVCIPPGGPAIEHVNRHGKLLCSARWSPLGLPAPPPVA